MEEPSKREGMLEQRPALTWGQPELAPILCFLVCEMNIWSPVQVLISMHFTRRRMLIWKMQAWVQSLFHFSGTSDLKHSISSNPTHSQHSWVHGGLSSCAEYLTLGIPLTSYIISMNYALSLYPFGGWRNLFKSWALNHILAHNRENAVYHTSVVLGLQLVLRKCSLPACVFAMHHSHCFKEERINKYAIIFQPRSTGVCGKLRHKSISWGLDVEHCIQHLIPQYYSPASALSQSTCS